MAQEGEIGPSDVHFHHFRASEKSRFIARRIYFSSGYVYVYGFILLVNLAVIIWTFADPSLYANKGNWSGREIAFLLLEITINLVLIIEVLLKYASDRESFWSKKSNWFDAVVLLLCLVDLTFFLGGKAAQDAVGEEVEEVEDEVSTFLRILRYFVMTSRLVSFIKNTGSRRTKSQHQTIDFTRLSTDAEGEDGEGEWVPSVHTPGQSRRPASGSDSDGMEMAPVPNL